MYQIEEQNGKYYVIPTAETVMDNFNRFDLPYDSNWEIYKLFGYEPKDFLNYIISAFNARVIIQYEFPWVQFYFHNYIEAEFFLKEVQERVNKP